MKRQSKINGFFAKKNKRLLLQDEGTGGSTGVGGGVEHPPWGADQSFFFSTNKNVNRISVVESVLFHTGTTINSTLPASVHALS